MGSPLLTSQDLADLFDPVNASGITPSSVHQLTAALSAGPVPGALPPLLPLLLLLLLVLLVIAGALLSHAYGLMPSSLQRVTFPD